ncbi:MAG: hypothetical protein CFE21_08340 [Bacteroidetes bacterium B1(2017)]|nr:MAG: hypothetical protein CFE21_08340 [Bacteroidetes bacterium B1(2017)]
MSTKFCGIVMLDRNWILKVLLLVLLSSTFTSKTYSQTFFGVDYISPYPQSKYNSVETNIIIRFKQPLPTSFDAKRVFYINTGTQKLPYHVIEQSDRYRLLLKTDQKLPIASIITVQIKEEIELEGGIKVAPFQFTFITNSKEKIEGFVNEDWLKPKKAIPSETRKTESGTSSGTGIAISNEINNQVPFNMYTSIADTDAFFLLTSMYSPRNNDRNVIVNAQGKYIYDMRVPYLANNFCMQPDSTFSYTLLSNNIEDYCFILMDKTLKVVDTLQAGNGYLTDLHEITKDPQTGNYFILADRILDVDMTQLVKDGKPDAKLMDIVIQELDQNHNVLFEWKAFDHLPISDVVGVDLTATGTIDYIHSNSISLDSDTTLLLSSRHFCEVTRIDRRTGQIIWRLGPNASSNSFTFTNDFGFTYQHHAQRLANGNILLFDNGNFRPGARYSRAVEYQLDEVNMRATKVWEYRHSPDVMAYFMGSVQRLSNGNTVIGWGSDNPNLTEVDSSNHVIFEGSFPDNVMSYRVYKHKIGSLLRPHQPVFEMPENYVSCKLNDPNFTNKLIYTIQPYVDPTISEDYQLFNLTGTKLNLTLLDTSNHFYSYHKRDLSYRYVKIAQKDSLICAGKGLFTINMADNCENSTYLWNTGERSNEIIYQTKDNLNKVYVKTSNGLQNQTDTLYLTVSPIDPFDIIGDPYLTKPYLVLTYSIPYYKGFGYNWKSINGNIIGGFESNAVQVQWSNKTHSFLQATITDNYGCERKSSMDTIFYSQSANGMEELANATGIKVYPSPFKDQLNIQSEKEYTYKLRNLNGQEIIAISSGTFGIKTINTQDLANGIYIVDIECNGNQYHIKLVKE